MMPEQSPIHIPAYLRGEADADTLAGLVERGRRLGRFWPQAAVEPPAPPAPPRRHPVFRIGAREARIFGGLPE
ncbi:hypothetical protein DN069_11930 [Streptacidiphilus pinicola]|uniref:Uncharacterized protein n=1 Tax=Streptacidiphilus pinicola TaxID=2219663 RepID=A0A2X0IJX9_9ACTN|nr:hypothetical protein [Streptacidiphilus pinicola]RAG85362.1 hypothetical protein DN069_11930 [Streptacidiphilus pinicola]